MAHRSPKAPVKRGYPYQIESVERACQLMRVLQDQGSLPLFELARKVGLSRPTAFRLLATLQANGIVLKDGSRKYRLAAGSPSQRRYKIGYAAQTSEYGFSRAVTRSVVDCAAQSNVDLVLLDNQYSPDVALANAEKLLAEKVDLLMEFQTHSQVAALISAQASKHRVPLIAIEIPHPDATYFGVDNCQAGIAAGRYLARWAEQHWMGQIDEILLVGMPQAGPLPESRLTGSLLGIRQILPNSGNSKISVLSGNGQLEASREAVKRHLKSSTACRVLVTAINDLSAIGALEAFKDAERQEHCAVVGQNGSIEGRLEMRKPNSRFLGSIAYFPERYGEQLIALAFDILLRRNAPPRAVFIKHQLLTPGNLKQLYGREMRSAKAS